MSKGYDVRHTWYINNIHEREKPHKDKFKDSCLEDRIYVYHYMIILVRMI